MSDYIKREDALDIVAHNNVNGEITLNRYDKIIDGIYEIPPADVAPVRHGRWEVIDAEEPRRYGCSECKRLSWHMENYCPNCGAKMDGGDEDEKRQV